ncbi:MAG TPA: peptidoglycan DD-metalloendopeptidase family protein [Casimicrobiaceae bacterium]|nr:peptidoglycan DD-metalloendopeptidase family protein [Casimicrobiaceae bacterium]
MSSKVGILAQSAAALAERIGVGRMTAVGALMALGVVAAFGLVPETTLDTVPRTSITRELGLPATVPPPADEGYWREERIRRGDTLGSVLARVGVDDAPAQNFLRSDLRARPLYQLRPGKALRVRTDAGGRMLGLRYLTQSGELFAVDRIGDAFFAQSTAPGAAVSLELRSNEIRASLFGAADAVGLPDAVTMQLAEIFSGDIDFLHDLRRGDRFSVVYEMRRIDGEATGAGRIIAAEFVNKGISYGAYLWRAPDGTEGYYGEDGKSLKKAFLRSPVAFTRVTSGFSLARFHPFLQAWRAHKGVDFAAPSGTPVLAAGAGKVAFAGRQGGYGNVVMLQHGGAYSTVYAHLSRFAPGVKPGARVSQGDMVGYVGMTGWATGPHLHYEFRVDNVQKNPLTIALPNALPVPAGQKAAFLAQVGPLADKLALGRGVILAGGE